MRNRPLVLAGSLLVVALAGCAPAGRVSSTASPAPPAFPRIHGAVIDTSEPVAGDWRLRVRVADAGAAYRRARALLVARGYRLTADDPGTDGGSGQACTTALCVSFAAVVEQGGPLVEYEVFHSTGMSG